MGATLRVSAHFDSRATHLNIRSVASPPAEALTQSSMVDSICGLPTCYFDERIPVISNTHHIVKCNKKQRVKRNPARFEHGFRTHERPCVVDFEDRALAAGRLYCIAITRYSVHH